MSDILLIQPPVRDFYLTRKRTIPYGLSAIGASLLQNGFSVELLDCLATRKTKKIPYPQEMEPVRMFYSKPDRSPFSLFHHYYHFGYSDTYIYQVVRHSGAFLVGIASLFTPYQEEAIRVAEIVKKALPDCRVVIGGHHATVMPKRVMAHPVVDFLIRGEGEKSMTLLAESVREGFPVDAIPGIVFRNPAGFLHVSKPAVLADLDQTPLPAQDLISRKFYRRNGRGSLQIVASRGCPMKCTYCSMGASGWLPYRRRSVASVIREIEQGVEQADVRFLDFEDEHLSLNRKWFLHLLAEIQDRFGHLGLELRAMNGLYPPSLDQEMIFRMKQAGFRTLNLSVGTLSPAQQQRFGRPFIRTELESVLRMAGEIELYTVCYIIAGAPGQQAVDSVDDLLYFANQDTVVGVSIFYPAPGSSDFEKCIRLNLIPDHLSQLRSSALPVSNTTTRKQSATILRLGRIVNFIRHLIRKGMPLPSPQTYTGESFSGREPREEVGRRLLAWFLSDGRIRGVTPDGEVYEHGCDAGLITHFSKGLLPIIAKHQHPG